MISFGVGVLIASLLMNLSYSKKIQFDVESLARDMGMIYPEDVKVIKEKIEE